MSVCGWHKCLNLHTGAKYYWLDPKKWTIKWHPSVLSHWLVAKYKLSSPVCNATQTLWLNCCFQYSQALVGDREDHTVSWLPLLLHLSVELLIQGFTSVCWSAALWLGWGVMLVKELGENEGDVAGDRVERVEDNECEICSWRKDSRCTVNVKSTLMGYQFFKICRFI